MKYIIKIIDKGLEKYDLIYKNIKYIINNNKKINQIWILEHFPIFTLGINNIKYIFNNKKIIKNNNIYISNRGGNITYHAPGQIVIYLILNYYSFFFKNKIFIKTIIKKIEQAIIETLNLYNIKSKKKIKNPGIYIKNNNIYKNYKIAFLGLKLKNKYIYHGLSLNISINIKPFKLIFPCGDKNINIINMQILNEKIKFYDVKNNLINNLIKLLYIYN